MVKQFGGGICSLCGSKNSTKTTCPLNKEAKNPSPSKHYNAHSTTATPKSTGLTVDDYVDRMHSDMMRDFHYPSLPSGEFYIIHFTDKEIDDFIDKMLIAGKKMIKNFRDDEVYNTVSRNDKIKSIVLSSLGYDLTPDLIGVRISIIDNFVSNAINWTGDELTLKKKDALKDETLKFFARRCFYGFKTTMMPNWRMEPLCTMNRLETIKEFGKEIVGMPASLVKKCQYYLKTIMATDTGIKELRNLDNVLMEEASTYKFLKFPKKEDKFLQEFVGEIRNWVPTSGIIPVANGNIADILLTTMILEKLNNPEARSHLTFLMDFIDNNAHAMSIVPITSIVKILNYQ